MNCREVFLRAPVRISKLAVGYFDAPAARQACLGGQLMSGPLQPSLPLVTLVFCAIEGLADVKVRQFVVSLNVGGFRHGGD